MNYNYILKILCSLPIILIVSYFLPFIGICLIIARPFVYNKRNYYLTLIVLILSGVLILIPKFVEYLISSFKFGDNYLSLFTDIVNSDIYPSLLNYSKFLITVGIILLLIYSVLKKLIDKISGYVRGFISAREHIDAINRKENDMKMKIKQEKSQNTRVVYCPHCGADNIVSEAVGKCRYCRRNLEAKII